MHDAQVQKIAQACDFLEQEIERGLSRVAGEPDVGPRGHGGHGGRDVERGRPDIGDVALVTALS